jgi:hypothetical protein
MQRDIPTKLYDAGAGLVGPGEIPGTSARNRYTAFP